MEQIEPPAPLAAEDDRENFDCGRPSLNDWFTRHAWRNQQTGASRTSVIRNTGGMRIVGFVSLSAAQIEREYLAKQDRRNKPDPIPALLLGQLAVDRDFQGKGHAKSLLFFALTTAVKFSRDIGCFGVLTHPLDDALRGFYRHFGFENLPYDPKRAMIARIVDLERNGFGR